MEPQPRQHKDKVQLASRSAPPTPLPISRWRLAFFHWVARRRVSRAFRALRLANAIRVPARNTPNLIVVLNHPSWWDPLVGLLLSRHLFRPRNFYAPMDAVALERYSIFRRLGMFPVAMESPRGAAQFLRMGMTVLESGHILAVTPQGQFTDVRVRPVLLRPGVAALISRFAAQGRPTTVLPMALEYTFWDQRLPEALVNCGEPLRFEAPPEGDSSAPATQADIHAQLELRRDPLAFTSVLQGQRGTSGFYGVIERVRALVGGSTQVGDHQSAAAAEHSSGSARNP